MSSAEALERGRASYATRAWLDAHTSLLEADRMAPLGAEDLELLATSAYMLGRDDEVVGSLERAHHSHVESGETLRAVRSAFWLGINQEGLAGITVPTTLIWGRHNRGLKLRVGEAASARYGWPLHVIEDAGDDPAIEQPEAFIAALRAALRPE